MEASAELSDGPGRQDEAGQKGNRSAVLGSEHAVRSLAFSLIQSSPKRERGGEKERINIYWPPPVCTAPYIHHPIGSSRSGQELSYLWFTNEESKAQGGVPQTCAQWGWRLLVVLSDFATPMLTSHLLPLRTGFSNWGNRTNSPSWLWTLFSAYTSKSHWPTAGGQHGRNLSAKTGREGFWSQGFLMCAQE